MAEVLPEHDHAWTIVSRANSKVARSPLHALVGSIVEEMVAAWRAGQAVRAEAWIERHPELAGEPEALLRVVYEELLLRRRSGEFITSIELMRRFPTFKQEMAKLLESLGELCPTPSQPSFPEVGTKFGDFRLVGELGRGVLGRVFLATHETLADRPMVLKITPRSGHEHLSLARLQHTHIVPLYHVSDWPTRNLRVLFFPYLGALTWRQMLDDLVRIPPGERRGEDVLAALERHEARVAVPASTSPPARARQMGVSYVELVCRFGAALAETLHYSHERGLLHLDVKPSNILLAADGQPMLLDFHVARAPVEAGQRVRGNLGGTPGYMAPEHEQAMKAANARQAVEQGVDGRADVYSLGVVLYETLGGRLLRYREVTPLSSLNPHVSVGLSDIVHKCLARNPADRYPHSAALATDLRRHLHNQPLRGVRNRSFAERWTKWRRRRPHALVVTLLAPCLFAALATALVLWLNRAQERRREAETALWEGQAFLREHRYGDAVRAFTRGQEFVEGSLSDGRLGPALAGHLRIAQRAEKAQELHQLAESLRFVYLIDPAPMRSALVLQVAARDMWAQRELLLDAAGARLESEAEAVVRDDLVDVAIGLADLGVRLRRRDRAEAMGHEALRTLAEAETWLGRSPGLLRERQALAEALGMQELAQTVAGDLTRLVPESAWDRYAVARVLMRSGKLLEAAEMLAPALQQQPHAFWPNFCTGQCALARGGHEEAVNAYSICIGQAPQRPECFLARARACAALGRIAQAYQDLGRAQELRPHHPDAYLQRGRLSIRQNRTGDAWNDLTRATLLGADAAIVPYHLAAALWDPWGRVAAIAHEEIVLAQR